MAVTKEKRKMKKMRIKQKMKNKYRRIRLKVGGATIITALDSLNKHSRHWWEMREGGREDPFGLFDLRGW